MKIKPLASVSLAAALSLSLAAPSLAANEAPAVPYTIPQDVAGKLVVIHTNDTHGHDVAVEGETVGTAGVAALRNAFEEAGADVLLFSAGDFSQGTTLVSLDKGASAIQFMNAAGYDAAALGNHEFDYKMDALRANAAQAEFPLLTANILDSATGNPLFGDHMTFDTEIGKVGVFGLDTPETMTKAHPDNVKGLTFYQGDELVKCAEDQVKALENEKCDYIIALCHLGTDPESEPNRSIDIFQNIEGVDLIIDGHSHTEMEGDSAVTVGSAVAVSTGEYLNNVGVVITDGETTNTTLVSAAAWTAVDEKVAAVVNARNEAVSAELEKTFASTEVKLDGARDPGVRTQETNLGDFAADAILWQARQSLGEDQVDLALTNGGGIRASIEAGDITMNDMKTVFPFGNEVATIELTGAALLEALEAATCSTPTAIGAFPQVAGVRFTIDTNVPYQNGAQYPDSTYFAPAAPGTRIKDVQVNGEPLDLAKTYVLATNDFTAAGGDTYYAFQASTVHKTGAALEDALVNYTRDVLNNRITAEKYGTSAGRITILDAAAGMGDVTSADWFAPAVRYTVSNQIMAGTGSGFEPYGTLTKGQVLQSLYNLYISSHDGASFAVTVNVPETLNWAKAALNWAAANGLYEGTEYTEDTTITRSETARLMADYCVNVAGMTAGSTEIPSDTLLTGVPAEDQDGVAWCFANQIMVGNENGDPMPAKTLTRAEWAQIVTNLGVFAAAQP